jgi:hypothetical protein
MDENTTYEVKLVISSTRDPEGHTRIAWEWNPPLSEVLEESAGDVAGLPSAYRIMGKVLDDSVLPILQFNERYEAELNLGNEMSMAFGSTES